MKNCEQNQRGKRECERKNWKTMTGCKCSTRNFVREKIENRTDNNE